MSRIDYVAHLRAESDLFVAAAAGNFDKTVPPCPGWTVRDRVTVPGHRLLEREPRSV